MDQFLIAVGAQFLNTADTLGGGARGEVMSNTKWYEFVSLTLFFSINVSAAVIHVPDDEPTIQAGISAANDGDTVLVADGTYPESLNFRGKAIIVKSENGPESCHIDEGTFRFDSGETQASELDGFTIKNSHMGEEGIDCYSSSPTIRNCIFIDIYEGINLYTDSNSAISGCRFVGCRDGIKAYMSDCEISQCTFEDNFSGIDIDESTWELFESDFRANFIGVQCSDSDVVMSNCDFSHNVGNGGASFVDVNLNISDCRFSYNEDESASGGGLSFSGKGNVQIDRCQFQGNIASINGGGACLSDRSFHDPPSVTVSECVFIGNYSCFGCGGLSLSGEMQSACIEKCSFNGNKSDAWGGGLNITSDNSHVNSCVFRGNGIGQRYGGYGGGAVHAGGSHNDINNCIFESNYACKMGGAIMFGGTATLTNCLFNGNFITDDNFGDNNDWHIGGGALYMFESQVDIVNCTIANNSSPYNPEYSAGGGAIHFRNCPMNNVVNCIIWNNSTPSIVLNTGQYSVTYSDVSDGHSGLGNINALPQFMGAYWGTFYLSAASPCVNSGCCPSDQICYNTCYQNVCLSTMTTQTNAVPDSDTVDMGYHYSRSIPDTSIRTEIIMEDRHLEPGDTLNCILTIHNDLPETLFAHPCFMILDIYGDYFFAPGFSSFDYYLLTYPSGALSYDVFSELQWPEGAGSGQGTWYAAVTDPLITQIVGEMDICQFSWSE